MIRKGVYYKRSLLVSDANAELALRSKPIKRLSKKSTADIVPFILKHSLVALDEAALKVAHKKIIFVLNAGGKPTAPNATRLLASQSAQSGRNVLICDTTGKSNEKIKGKVTEQISNITIVDMGMNINIMTEAKGASFFTSKNFNSTIKELTDRFDQIFICSINGNAQLGLMALAELAPGLVVIAGLRKTRKLDIKNIKSKQPIDLLFYD